MKSKIIISAALLAAVAMFSMGVQAEPDASNAPAASAPEKKFPP